MLAAQLATGLHTDQLDRFMAQDPPARLPYRPLSFLGANATIRWGEWKAGREL